MRESDSSQPPLIAIQSAHDIGSAVAHRLKREGYAPVLLESPTPKATRYLMCFAGAVHHGEAELEGMRAVRCANKAMMTELARAPGTIPLWVTNLDDPLPWPVAVLVDARMRKKQEAPLQIDLAPLVIGIGPGFQAGVHAHLVIESNWGENLGRVIHAGGTEAYTGKHRKVEGVGAQRYVYTPRAGIFRTQRHLLELVAPGDEVGRIAGGPGEDDVVLRVEAGGILRGLGTSGQSVEAGAKLVEVDPSGEPDNCRGIADRPARIAQGVLDAMGTTTTTTKTTLPL